MKGQGAQRKLGAFSLSDYQHSSICMQKSLKLFVGMVAFGLFCACAAYLLSGIKEFENTVAAALLTNKSEVAATAAAKKEMDATPVPEGALRVWK